MGLISLHRKNNNNNELFIKREPLKLNKPSSARFTIYPYTMDPMGMGIYIVDHIPIQNVSFGYTVDVIFVHGVTYSRSQWIIILISRGSGAGVAQMVERQTEKPGVILTRVRVPCAARNFSPRVYFQCRLSDGVRTAPVCSRMHQQLFAR